MGDRRLPFQLLHCQGVLRGNLGIRSGGGEDLVRSVVVPFLVITQQARCTRAIRW
jgi:hypothetical protein